MKPTWNREYSDVPESERFGQRYDFVIVDQNGFERHAPRTSAALAASFTDDRL